MNRIYVTPVGFNLTPEVEDAIKAEADERGRANCHGEVSFTVKGLTYEGKGIHSSMNDLQLTLNKPTKAKAEAKQAAPAKKSGKK